MQSTETTQQPFSPHEIIEGLRQQLAENYVFPDKAHDVATALHQHLAAGAYHDIKDGDLLAQTITEHMREASHDKHLHLYYQASGVVARQDDNEMYTPEEIEAIRQKSKRHYGLKKIEILDGDIGYFQFNEFVHPHFAGGSMSAAMTMLAHTRALIIDLRANGGGEACMVQYLGSYFFDAFMSEHIQMNGLYDRRKNLLYQYWVFPYVPGQRYLDKPVYILTSQRTFSAAEAFAYDLQQLKRALVVGETTGGGAHAGLRYPITSHFEAFIPNVRAVNPVSGTNWEGVGVQPDLPVEQEKALELAYQKALEATRS
ncbi:S41 family peptidase [Dictyobacter aurantiacus]|uniref:Interphotoreceptor retinoid-binding protein n=1 Tax=Dictyobacter aurantiacus TaxID=1936993 RepID=A0A401ZGU4_9CHLR|nr:S41 family peptidase [Dictyobacter aurantiacus]GCE06105.1 interphotoreceptor retinoid-binding protein [Dictyobacter aurantiacus]